MGSVKILLLTDEYKVSLDPPCVQSSQQCNIFSLLLCTSKFHLLVHGSTYCPNNYSRTPSILHERSNAYTCFRIPPTTTLTLCGVQTQGHTQTISPPEISCIQQYLPSALHAYDIPSIMTARDGFSSPLLFPHQNISVKLSRTFRLGGWQVDIYNTKKNCNAIRLTYVCGYAIIRQLFLCASTAHLEVRPTAAANEQGVSGEARALVVEHKRHASSGVAGCGTRLHVPCVCVCVGVDVGVCSC